MTVLSSAPNLVGQLFSTSGYIVATIMALAFLYLARGQFKKRTRYDRHGTPRQRTQADVGIALIICAAICGWVAYQLFTGDIWQPTILILWSLAVAALGGLGFAIFVLRTPIHTIPRARNLMFLLVTTFTLLGLLMTRGEWPDFIGMLQVASDAIETFWKSLA